MERKNLTAKMITGALILSGSITWLLTVIKSGRIYSYGMGFWGPHGHDGVWHIALANSLKMGLFAPGNPGQRPGWEMPVFADESIKNYHVGFDLFLAQMSRALSISVVDLYFRVVPIVLSLTLGLLVYLFVLKWRKSRLQAVLSLFFVYFGGNFGWLVSLLRSGEIGGESMFWSSQAISTLINPPYAMSLLFIFLGLYLLLRLEKHSNLGIILMIVVIFSILMQIKVYAGLLVLVGLLVASVYGFVFKNRIDVFVVFILTAVSSYLIFTPLNSSSVSLVVFEPFWFLETLMGSSDRFDWPKFYQAMLAYKSSGMFPKAFLAYFVAFAIFVVGNFGTRILGLPVFLAWIKNFRKTRIVEVFVMTVIVSGIFVPMLFLQKGTAWNTIQFFYYSQVFAGILASLSLGSWLEKQKRVKLRTAILASLAVFTIPTTYGTLKHYLPSRPPAKISHSELEALKFLSSKGSGIVLTYPYSGKLDASGPPLPLYVYESTAYVSAFSGKTVFLEDEVNLEITGYNWKQRKTEILAFFDSWREGKPTNFLKKSDISYVYLVKEQFNESPVKISNLREIFKNDEVVVYEVI